jgi:hypothetical protein
MSSRTTCSTDESNQSSDSSTGARVTYEQSNKPVHHLGSSVRRAAAAVVRELSRDRVITLACRFFAAVLHGMTRPHRSVRPTHAKKCKVCSSRRTRAQVEIRCRYLYPYGRNCMEKRLPKLEDTVRPNRHRGRADWDIRSHHRSSCRRHQKRVNLPQIIPRAPTQFLD